MRKKKKGKLDEYDNYNTQGEDQDIPYEEYDDPAGYSDYYDDTEYDEPVASPGRHKKSKGRTDTGRMIMNGLIIAIAIVGILLIYSAVMSFVGPSRSQCKELVNDIQRGCNELDVKRLVNCLNPDIKSTVMPLIVGGELLTGTNLQNILRTILRALGLDSFSDDNYESSLQNIIITPNRYGIPFVTRKVRCKVSIIGTTHHVVFTIKKHDGEAYLDKVVVLD